MNEDSNLDKLIDEMVNAVNSKRNKNNKKFWKEQPPWARDCWRGIPYKNKNGVIPFTVDPEKQLWAHIVNFDVSKYWLDPDVHLEGQLKMKLHKFRGYQDNTYLTGNVSPWMGVVFELSMFGFDIQWRDDRDPWITGGPILKDYDDLDDLNIPDFYESGLMPRAHKFYKKMEEKAGDRLNIVFPDWVRGPFCIALHLRGFDNILVDMMSEPKGVHKLMRFVTEAHKKWCKQRSEFTGKPIKKGKLYTDELDCPTISPEMYREFILPYEKEISEFHDGIVYYHSCGNLTPFLKDIKEIPNLEMIHISPWTKLEKALEILPPDQSLDICLYPARDVLQVTTDKMKEKLENIVKKCRERKDAACSIRADAFEIINGAEKDRKKIYKWSQIAKKVTGQ